MLLYVIYLLLSFYLISHEYLVVLWLNQLFKALLLRLFLLGAKVFVNFWLKGVLLSEGGLTLGVDFLSFVMGGRSALRHGLLQVVAYSGVVKLRLHMLVHRVPLWPLLFLSPDRKLMPLKISKLLP